MTPIRTLIVIGFLGVSLPLFGQQCPKDSGYRGSFHFASSAKAWKSVEKLKQFPPTVMARIDQQLEKRIGNGRLAQIKFEYGRVVDFDSDAPLSASDTSRIDGYELTFRFSDLGKGIKNYYFTIGTDSSGKLLEEPALPPTFANANVGISVTCDEALSIAFKNDFPKASSISFEFDFDVRTFVWKIQDPRSVQPDDPLLQLVPLNGYGWHRYIYIDALTGEVVRIRKETIAV